MHPAGKRRRAGRQRRPPAFRPGHRLDHPGGGGGEWSETGAPGARRGSRQRIVYDVPVVPVVPSRFLTKVVAVPSGCRCWIGAIADDGAAAGRPMTVARWHRTAGCGNNTTAPSTRGCTCCTPATRPSAWPSRPTCVSEPKSGTKLKWLVASAARERGMPAWSAPEPPSGGPGPSTPVA